MIHAFVSLVTRHWLSLVGSIVALVAVVMMLMLMGLQLTGLRGGAYLGIVTYILLPTMLALGLVLIPAGGLLRRRAERRAADGRGVPPKGLPVIDLNNERTRGVVVIVVVVGVLSTVLIGGATVKGLGVMESVAFCGTACHSVMEPQHTAFLRSPHNRITCADCHIGEGAGSFVRSKLAGSWQLVSVMFNLYPRPVPTPVHDLRPARDTCEQCHWPTRHVGDRLRVTTRFGDDEANTETKTVMLMKVGGQQGSTSTGIHWHVDRGVQIRYLTDATRQKVFDIELVTPDGRKRVYKTADKPDVPVQWREMDCVDCHNRPTHIFHPADRELDRALEDGRIDKSLPFVKREGLRLLTEGTYASKEEAKAGIAGAIEAFYKTKYPELSTAKAAQVQAAGVAIGAIHSWNVFPRMKVTWGTYVNNLGHSDEAPGCFRCHDKKHAAEDGSKIGRNCKTCHAVLAEDEADPEILKAIRK